MSEFHTSERYKVVTARIHEFTNESIHLPGRETKTEYTKKGDMIESYIKVFANGFSEDTEGYVCIAYYSQIQNLDVCCIISTLDVSGHQRFPRSFTITDMKKKEYEQISYISREKLLSDTHDLLPNDTLTLTISMHFSRLLLDKNLRSWKLNQRYTKKDDIIRPSFQIIRPLNALPSIKLYFDSSLVMCLKEESNFFRGITSVPMAEKYANAMPIDENEYRSFRLVEKIIMTECALMLRSIKEIFDLFIIADKYDIPSVTESCRGFLILCLFDHTVDDYLKLANEYENGCLKELIIAEINAVSLIDFDKETERDENAVRLKEPIRKWQWLYVHEFKGDFLIFLDVNSLQKSDNELENVEAFDFYK